MSPTRPDSSGQDASNTSAGESEEDGCLSITGPGESEPSGPSPSRKSTDHPTGRSESRRNFVALAANQILLRTGWIFKTESIVMPAVLDSIAGPGWVRGWLPLLNRFGHSFAPLFLARRVKVARRKKWILAATTACMGLLFLLLGYLFVGSVGNRGTLQWAFLAIYAAFFMCNGISQLAFGTLQGKLIPTMKRGKLLLASTTIGAIVAVTCALVLLPAWMQHASPRFDLIFGFSGALFVCSAIAVVFLVEPVDDYREPVKHFADDISKSLTGAWSTWRHDANFRRLSIVAAIFGSSIMLFPHYQNLGLQQLQLKLDSLVTWVVIQNTGTGLFGIPAGHLADRYGNRLVLLVATLGLATAPVLAIVFVSFPEWGGRMFPGVFVFVGLTPVILRTLQNFTLELCIPEDHPRYLSTLALCMTAPVLLSPFVGWFIDFAGFRIVFLGMAAIVTCGWALTFGLREPRDHVHMDYLQSVD